MKEWCALYVFLYSYGIVYNISYRFTIGYSVLQYT